MVLCTTRPEPGRVATTRARRIAVSILVRFAPEAVTTTEHYNKVIRRLQDTGGFPAEGLEYHVYFLADGNVRVSDGAKG
jgi:hypothetical protein